MDIQKLTKEQAVIISGFTGILCGEFSDFHADVEKRLGRGVQTFEFGFKKFATEVKKLYEADFIEMGTVDKEQAKAQAVPEWISTEDKEPVENGNYLVCIDGDVFYLTAKWVKNHFKFLARGYGLTEDFTDWRYCEGVKVTHWMLLPDSPKAQDSAND